MKDDKKMASLFLARYLNGLDAVLAEFQAEAENSGDDFYMETFLGHLDDVEESLANVIWYSRKLKDDIVALKGRKGRTLK